MPSRNPSRLCRVHSSVINHPCHAYRGGFMSPSLRRWASWWWPLVHLRSFRCRLLDGSHYICTLYRVQIKTTQTPLKPLQTLAFIGVSQPYDGDTKRRRHGHGHGTAGVTSRTRRDGHSHDGRDHARPHHQQSRHTKERARAIPHDTPKHNHTNVPTSHIQHPP